MAKHETNVVHDIMVGVSPSGGRLFKNVRGGFYPVGAVKPLLAAIMRADWRAVVTLAKQLRPMQAGLQANGSSDLIGAMPVVVTQDMVGETIAVFCAVEVKTATGTVQPEQRDFVSFVEKIGGYAGIARNLEDAKKIMRIGA